MKVKHICKSLKMAMCTALMGIAFIACGDSETDTLSRTEETKVQLSISAVKQDGTNTDPRKADYDATKFESGDEIGLYVLSADDLQSVYSSDYTCYNVRATYNGKSWKLDNVVYLYDENAYVIAYYPYTESFGNSIPIGEDGKFVFDLTPTDDNEQTDVLASEGVYVNSDSPNAELAFNHVLTRVTLSIEISEDIETTASLTSASISGTLYSDIGLYIEGGSFKTYSQTSTEDLTLSLNETLSTTETNVDFLITSESSTTLTAALEIEGSSCSFELTTDDGWMAGYQYTYPVIITTISETEDDSTDDETTYYNGYEVVDLGLSVKWATMNVGAESPEDYGNYYAWGETSTKSNYSQDYCVTSGVEIDDFSGNAVYDAATSNWGGSWRMPTYIEMEELVDDCTWTWTKLNDVRGYLITGNNGNSIFLPAAGYRFGGYSAIESAGKSGYYWSSSPNESDTDYAYYLVFHSSSINVFSTGVRGSGRQVRPVSE